MSQKNSSSDALWRLPNMPTIGCAAESHCETIIFLPEFTDSNGINKKRAEIITRQSPPAEWETVYRLNGNLNASGREWEEQVMSSSMWRYLQELHAKEPQVMKKVHVFELNGRSARIDDYYGKFKLTLLRVNFDDWRQIEHYELPDYEWLRGAVKVEENLYGDRRLAECGLPKLPQEWVRAIMTAEKVPAIAG